MTNPGAVLRGFDFNIEKAQLFWAGGVSAISGTHKVGVSGTISDLKTIMLITNIFSFHLQYTMTYSQCQYRLFSHISTFHYVNVWQSWTLARHALSKHNNIRHLCLALSL